MGAFLSVKEGPREDGRRGGKEGSALCVLTTVREDRVTGASGGGFGTRGPNALVHPSISLPHIHPLLYINHTCSFSPRFLFFL